MHFGQAVTALSATPAEVVVHTAADSFAAHRVVACAGLHADRLARTSGLDPQVRIIPFRGEYSQLRRDRSYLVRGLVYPTPDPELPFLGVHLTPGLDGVVHVGPNAVPALAREGYDWSTFSVRDLADSLAFPGAWRLARRYGRVGLGEAARSLARRSLAAAARQLLPDLRPEDLEPSMAGVRAQAVTRSGQLVDDFLLRRDGRVLHVLNAPSPAATACLAIGEEIVDRLLAD